MYVCLHIRCAIVYVSQGNTFATHTQSASPLNKLLLLHRCVDSIDSLCPLVLFYLTVLFASVEVFIFKVDSLISSDGTLISRTCD